MTEVSTLRLYLLRAMYLLIAGGEWLIDGPLRARVDLELSAVEAASV